MRISEIKVDTSLVTFEGLKNNLAVIVINIYNLVHNKTVSFSDYARDVYTREEINDYIYELKIALQEINNSNLTKDSQTYKIAAALLDYFNQ